MQIQDVFLNLGGGNVSMLSQMALGLAVFLHWLKLAHGISNHACIHSLVSLTLVFLSTSTLPLVSVFVFMSATWMRIACEFYSGANKYKNTSTKTYRWELMWSNVQFQPHTFIALFMELLLSGRNFQDIWNVFFDSFIA